MSQEKSPIGTIGWFDLTIENTEEVKDFYAAVVGWAASPLSMGDYDDFVMATPESGSPVAGICHAQGENEGLPAQWLMYVNVSDVNASIATCKEKGGTVVMPLRKMPGQGQYCVIQDPAGAVLALFEQE